MATIDIVSTCSDPNSILHLCIGFTLVDITATGQTNGRTQGKLRDQQRNWETLVQVISLRAQPIVLHSPTVTTGNLSFFEFGEAFEGADQKIWSFKFGVEHEAIYGPAGSQYSVLRDDFAYIPIIAGLDETVEFTQPVFVTNGPTKNIYFRTLKTDK